VRFCSISKRWHAEVFQKKQKLIHSMTAFAFVFPGQGSQSVGMLDAWGDHPVVRQTLDEACDALGQDMAALIHAGPKEELDLTTNTQPVMLTAGIACYRAWRHEGGAEPSMVAGHSLGEYTALVAAGALTLAEALPLVRFRAQAMQEAVPVGVGAMAAILGLDALAVQDGCAEVSKNSGEVVEAANYNDPKQTVIAGSKAGVDQACELLKAKGAKRALLLPVSAPFHSSLMRPAADKLRMRLAEVAWKKPRIPVLNNIDVQDPTEAAAICDALYRQAYGPVRWVEVVQAMRARGLTHIFECGPGKVLAGITKRVVPEAVGASIFDLTSSNDAKGLLV
jgi:[acyl-carrier-protein] S-malonyltransferase